MGELVIKLGWEGGEEAMQGKGRESAVASLVYG